MLEFKEIGLFRKVIMRLFGRYEWGGEPGAEDSALLIRLGNTYYAVSDAEVERERNKLKAAK